MLVHPLVVHFPIALWLTGTFFDLLAWRRGDAQYRRMAYWLVGLGLLGALVSIAFGWVDLLNLEQQGVGMGLVLLHRVHSAFAYAATVTYAVNFEWRRRRQNRFAVAIVVLSLLGAVLISITGYLGGQLRNIM